MDVPVRREHIDLVAIDAQRRFLDAVAELAEKTKVQKGIILQHDVIPGANHFFENELEDLMGSVDNYLDFRLDARSWRAGRRSLRSVS